ncbi:DHA2 family efflux MFS transporter permease subunit [Jeotgalicoccus nanhaiensis]|uniref:DHA2 family efflux MFS transporter permease subunit n=1 Tax=Jeotgalicoccus nanhaiensis TaxID=568603 RepID=A0ABR9Y0L2_9STAP|nr:DHA2 family efflux MFS transporter permease subunit [Jeotgalicoccus nanhaiensis]MBF0754575.1 DHA2 family efflux MFS transporter permease subunit [Jeotgalicoccus nanhaiensis]TFU61095.1 DHA2 family efflux MFS transporter permease subunit [Jeotgalicoccus nanhaiensis]
MSLENENNNQLTGKSRTILMAVLLSGAFAAILNQTLLATAIPHIMTDLNLDADVAQWLQSVFMLVNGIMIPITAFLINKFSTRTLFFTAMSLFGIGTLICGISPSFPVLLTGRILQAAGAGIVMPLMQTILFLVYPRDQRGKAMGMFGLVISFAPAIGPTLSGWFIDIYPWRGLFYMILPIVAIDLIVAHFILRNVTEKTNPKLDMTSIILSTLGFGGLLYGFSAAGNSGWLSLAVILPIIIGAIALVLFIKRQNRLEEPILEFGVFKDRIFTLSTSLGMIVFMSMIGGAVILPIFMQTMLGFSAMESGMMLLPGALMMGIMSPVTGRLFDKYGAKWLAIIGLGMLTVTTLMFATLNTETTFTYLAVVNTFRMLGVAMVMMPVTTAGLNRLTNRLVPHGTAMNNTMRQVAGAVGTALLVSIMTNMARPEQGVEGMIHGVNMSFLFAGILAFIGFILAFRLRKNEDMD